MRVNCHELCQVASQFYKRCGVWGCGAEWTAARSDRDRNAAGNAGAAQVEVVTDDH